MANKPPASLDAPQRQGGEQEARCTDPTNCRRCSEDATTPHAGIPRGEQDEEN